MNALLVAVLTIAATASLAEGYAETFDAKLFYAHTIGGWDVGPHFLQSADFCQKIGGRLVGPFSDKTKYVLARLQWRGAGAFWVNAVRPDNQHELFKWRSDGTVVEPHLWCDGEPTCLGECAAVFGLKRSRYCLLAYQQDMPGSTVCSFDLPSDADMTTLEENIALVNQEDREFILRAFASERNRTC